MKLEPIADTPPVTLAPRDEKARRRSNAAPGYRLPFTAESLESGVDLETLLSLPVPVLAYATQITIHGILADFQPGIVCNYKHLTRNQNGSLGVRWGAIDAGKKSKLRECIRWVRLDSDRKGTPWFSHQDSKGTCVFRSIETIAEGRAAIAALPTGIYGSASIMRCTMSGTLYVDVEVGAIALDALWSVISHFAPGYDCEETLRARDARAECEMQARQAADEKAQAERAARQARTREILKSLAARHLVAIPSWKPEPGKIVRVTKLGSIVRHTLEKRGPNLCIMRQGKGKVVSKDTLRQWQEDAAAGYFFRHDEARLAGFTAALKELEDSMKSDAAKAAVTPQPPKVEAAPAAPAVSALDFF